MLKADDGLRARVTGSAFGPSTPVYQTFMDRYNLKFPAEKDQFSPAVFGAPGAYDAVFLLAYAKTASRALSDSGATLAQGLQELSDPGGVLVNAGGQEAVTGVSSLISPGTINYNGASGPLDMEPSVGEAPSDVGGSGSADRAWDALRLSVDVLFDSSLWSVLPFALVLSLAFAFAWGIRRQAVFLGAVAALVLFGGAWVTYSYNDLAVTADEALNPIVRYTGSLALLERKGQTFTLVEKHDIGRIPEGVAFTSDGRHLIVQCHPDRELWIFSVKRGRLKDTGQRIKVPGMPSSLRAAIPAKRK
jgi:hypothetical protein